jgi:hypothetical protein
MFYFELNYLKNSNGWSNSSVGNWSWSSDEGWGSRVTDDWSSGRVRDSNWGSDVGDDWGMGSIRVVLSNGVGKVTSESVGLDDGRVESWGTGNDGRSTNGNSDWRDDSSRSSSHEGKNNKGDLG